MKRNASIELLRCVLMFGICLCHSVGAGGNMCEPVRNVCMMCTVGFMFITGWFGIRFSFTRVLKLMGVAIFAGVIVMAEDWCIHGKFTENFLFRIRQWWFLNAYLMLMLLAPILNCIVRSVKSSDLKSRREAYFAVGLIAFVLYCVCWPMHSGWISRVHLLMTVGAQHLFGTISTIYLLARLCKELDIYEKVNGLLCGVFVAIAIAFALFDIKFSRYNSPCSFVFAFSVFYFFREIDLNDCILGKICYICAPSMFFVYLFHSHQDPGFVILSELQAYIISLHIPIPVAWILTALTIFCGGLLIDLIRRSVFYAIRYEGNDRTMLKCGNKSQR